MIQSIINLIISSQQSVDGGRKTYGSNAPESAVYGLLRVNNMEHISKYLKKWRELVLKHEQKREKKEVKILVNKKKEYE